MLDTSLIELGKPSAQFEAIVRAMALASQQDQPRSYAIDEEVSREGELVAWLSEDLEANFRIVGEVLSANIVVDQHASKSVDAKSFRERIAYHRADRSHEFVEIVRRVSEAASLVRPNELLQLASRVVKEYEPVRDVEKWADELIRSVGRTTD